MSEFVRARCPATGHIAALPKAALDIGAIPGWEEVKGPKPDRPKPRKNLTALTDKETNNG